MRGAIRNFIEATTPYKVCDAVDDGASAVRKAMDSGCDVVLLNLIQPQDNLVTASLLRSKLPSVKIVGFGALSVDNDQLSRATAFDAVVTKQDGLSRLVETLKALIPKPLQG